jgi:uncharacterized membrane protein
MSDLIAVAYDDRATAERVRDELAALTREHVIEIADAVVVERREDGKVKLHQTINPAGAGAAGGALWGGLIGLGVDDKFMKELGENLPENGAALIVLGGRVIQSSLSTEAEEKLQEALSATATSA